MPRLAFYAGPRDLEPIVDFLLVEAKCTVYESHSLPDERLRSFVTPVSVVDAFGDGSRGLQLALYTPAMKGVPLIEQFDLTPGAGLGKWRESIAGWGLIQLVFGALGGGELAPSVTDHNSAARAKTWESTHSGLGPAAAWDFDEVTRVSRLLNRHIKRLAHSKVSHPIVLPDAQALLDAGLIKLRKNW